MWYVRLITIGLVLSIFMAGCEGSGSSFDSQLLEQAGVELDTTLTNLPIVQKIEVVDTFTLQFQSTEEEQTCYYARGYVILGSEMPVSDVLEKYVEGLRHAGWELRNRQYDYAKSLDLGSQDRLEVWYGEPGIDIKQQVDLEQIQQGYDTVVFVRVDHILPSMAEC